MKFPNQRRTPVPLLAAAVVLIAGLSSAEPRQEPPRAKAAKQPVARPGAGEPAPAFEVRTVSKEMWRLADHRNEIVVLEWIDPECPIVARQHSPEGTTRIASLRTVADESVAWLAINSSDGALPQGGRDATTRAKEKLRIDYPVAADPTGWVGRAYGVTKSAHVIVIGRDGKIVYSGAPDDRAKRSFLDEAIVAAKHERELEVATTPAYGCAVRYPDGLVLGAAAPPITFRTKDGQLERLRDGLGSPVVVEWFNPECAVVREAHAEGGALHGAPARWKKELGAHWYLVNSAPTGHSSTESANEEAVKAWGLDVTIASDSNRALAESFHAKVTPQIFVFDERGVLVYRGHHTDEKTKKERPLDVWLQAFASDEPRPKPSETTAWGTKLVR